MSEWLKSLFFQFPEADKIILVSKISHSLKTEGEFLLILNSTCKTIEGGVLTLISTMIQLIMDYKEGSYKKWKKTKKKYIFLNKLVIYSSLIITVTQDAY